MTEHISGDHVNDLALNDSREVSLADTNDLDTVRGIDAVKQSVAIHAGNALRSLVGEPLSAQVYEDVQEELRKAIERDPQIDSVDRVNLVEIDKVNGAVTVDVFLSYNNTFRIEVTA